MTAARLAVIGGGWAGMAAAVQARLQGLDVALFEMAAQWGGRARRVDFDDLTLDNGQHIMIGAYRETLRLMRTVGIDPQTAFVRTPLQLLTPDGQGLSLPPGPPAWAFARGVVQQGRWPLGHRLALLAAAAGWLARGFRCDNALTVHALTAGLPASLREQLIEPLCVAALNTPAHEASGTVFLRVVRDALFGGRGSADLLLPRLPLSDLFPLPAAQWLADAGARLHVRTRVERLERSAGAWVVNAEAFEQVIVATTAVEASRLVERIAPAWAAMAASFSYEPILTVYAHSAGTQLPRPMFALPSNEHDSPAQFVFDLGQLGHREGVLGFVVSGAAPWLRRGVQVAQQLTLAQGERLLANHLRAPLQPLRTLTEKRATFRCVPGLQRPGGFIADGLHAAGDYVAGPYPATLEGAVRSGVDAVQALSASSAPAHGTFANGAANGSPMKMPC